jgi:hypothetical protein
VNVDADERVWLRAAACQASQGLVLGALGTCCHIGGAKGSDPAHAHEVLVIHGEMQLGKCARKMRQAFPLVTHSTAEKKGTESWCRVCGFVALLADGSPGSFAVRRLRCAVRGPSCLRFVGWNE